MLKTFPNISVIVCTYNGANTLNQCLQSLIQQNYPNKSIEIIVVDNASTDNTKLITNKYIRKSSITMRYVFESTLGLSMARNKGIEEAKGEIIAFIDDDAEADTSWLQHLSICYSNKDVWAAGGQSKPKYISSPPAWMPRKYLYILAVTTLGNRIKSVPAIIGSNMSFRRTAFMTIGGFRTDLGRVGKYLLSGEEIDYCQRILNVNKQIIYTPRAKVHHLVPDSRLTKKYFTKRLFMEGVSLAKLEKKGMSLQRIIIRLIYYRLRYIILAFVGILGTGIQQIFCDQERKRFLFWSDLVLNLGYVYGTLL